MLIAAGAHTDCLDDQGFLSEERAENNEIRKLLHSKRSISLKCQCTRLIISEGINYESNLPNNLKNFILMQQIR
jgi:aspartate-semialdehyde dehydrogenase